MKNEKVAYRVDFVTAHHCTKFRCHIYNIGDLTEGGTLCPPWYYKVPKSSILPISSLASSEKPKCSRGKRI